MLIGMARGYFRVPKTLTLETRLNAKRFLKMSFPRDQVIFMAMASHLGSLESRDLGQLGIGLLAK